MSPLRRYLTNALWSGAWAAVLLLSGFFVSPQIIRKLGASSFSVWTLALSLVEYFWLIDLGLRSATIKYAASYRALNDQKNLEVLINTGLMYSAVGGVFAVVLTFLAAPLAAHVLRIQHPDFIILIRIAGVSWAAGLVFSIFGAYVEACQRFDLAGRTWILGTALRALGVLGVLTLGYGLMAMAAVLVASQSLMYWLTYRNFRALAPSLPLQPLLAQRTMLKQMLSYGSHTLTINVAQRALSQSIPTVIVYFRSLEELAYWSVCVRTLEYAMDGIGRIGMITTPNAAEMHAHGDMARLRQLGVYTNRFCLAIFLPVTVFLLVYGEAFFALWIRPDFAANSAPFLPVLLIGYTLAAGQFNSSSILYGTGQHRKLARAWLAEAVFTVAGIAVALSFFGLYGAAWVLALGMALNRSVFVCWFFARKMNISAARYALDVAKPVLPAAISLVVMGSLKTWVWPGTSWGQMFLAVAVSNSLYLVIGYFFLLDAGLRALLHSKALAFAGRFRKTDLSESSSGTL